MSATLKAALLDQALTLTLDERASLARELLASLDGPEDTGVDEAWLDEAERRQREVNTGAVTLEDWADVRKRIAARLRSPRP
jgi:putative addiction module component (TIGR02574 family)